METVVMSKVGLLFSFLLLIIPLWISVRYQLRLVRDILLASVRMALQLVCIAMFMRYLFVINNAWLNCAWLVLMITVAVYSAITHSEIRMRKFIVPTFVAFMVSTVIIIVYINGCVLKLTHICDARYLIVLGGMLLGNSLRGNIIGIGSFYVSIKKDYPQYLYRLSFGMSLDEAVRPYFVQSVRLALKPTLAAMATMGIVSLPGMMTGAILGGVDPVMAVYYQIMIVIAILAVTILSVVLTLLITKRTVFSAYGMLQMDIFSPEKKV